MSGALSAWREAITAGSAGICAVLISAALALPAAAAPAKRPALTLSRTSGGAGTSVTIVGRNCVKPFAQADTLAWHDHYYWTHDVEKRPPLGVWRSVPLRRLSPTLVRATFTVRKTDHLGRGLLDLFCRGNANANATFTVTR